LPCFQVHSIRPATLVLSDKDGTPVEEVTVQRGESLVCLKSQSFVEFSTKGCEEFEITPAQIVDPASIDSNFRVTLKPVKFQVSGRISSKNPISDLKLVAASEVRKVEVETQKTSAGYSFSFSAFPGEDLLFQPKSEEHLFDPESLHVFVDNDCHLVRFSHFHISLRLNILNPTGMQFAKTVQVGVFRVWFRVLPKVRKAVV
jgi:hypothetical protein